MDQERILERKKAKKKLERIASKAFIRRVVFFFTSNNEYKEKRK